MFKELIQRDSDRRIVSHLRRSTLKFLIELICPRIGIFLFNRVEQELGQLCSFGIRQLADCFLDRFQC